MAIASVVRPVVSRLPERAQAAALLSVVPVYMAHQWVQSRSHLGQTVYGFREAIHAARHRLTPPYTHRHRESELEAWFRNLGYEVRTRGSEMSRPDTRPSDSPQQRLRPSCPAARSRRSPWRRTEWADDDRGARTGPVTARPSTLSSSLRSGEPRWMLGLLPACHRYPTNLGAWSRSAAVRWVPPAAPPVRGPPRFERILLVEAPTSGGSFARLPGAADACAGL
jgi:hypothetical protein